MIYLITFIIPLFLSAPSFCSLEQLPYEVLDHVLEYTPVQERLYCYTVLNKKLYTDYTLRKFSALTSTRDISNEHIAKKRRIFLPPSIGAVQTVKPSLEKLKSLSPESIKNIRKIFNFSRKYRIPLHIDLSLKEPDLLGTTYPAYENFNDRSTLMFQSPLYCSIDFFNLPWEWKTQQKLPFIESISLSLSEYDDYQIANKDPKYHPENIFPNLKKFTLIKESELSLQSLMDCLFPSLLEYFTLPGLTHIHLKLDNDQVFCKKAIEGILLKVSKPNLNLTHLKLKNTSIYEDFNEQISPELEHELLGGFFASFPNLKTLKYNYHVLPKTVEKLLPQLHQKSSLRKLTIGPNEIRAVLEDQSTAQVPDLLNALPKNMKKLGLKNWVVTDLLLDSLKDFKELEQLKIVTPFDPEKEQTFLDFTQYLHTLPQFRFFNPNFYYLYDHNQWENEEGIQEFMSQFEEFKKMMRHLYECIKPAALKATFWYIPTDPSEDLDIIEEVSNYIEYFSKKTEEFYKQKYPDGSFFINVKG